MATTQSMPERELCEQLRGRAVHFVEIGALEWALALLDLVAALEPSDPTVALAAATLCIELGRYDDAAERLAMVPPSYDVRTDYLQLKTRVAFGRYVQEHFT